MGGLDRRTTAPYHSVPESRYGEGPGLQFGSRGELPQSRTGHEREAKEEGLQLALHLSYQEDARRE
jgi:hypothetical protein